MSTLTSLIRQIVLQSLNKECIQTKVSKKASDKEPLSKGVRDSTCQAITIQQIRFLNRTIDFRMNKNNYTIALIDSYFYTIRYVAIHICNMGDQIILESFNQHSVRIRKSKHIFFAVNKTSTKFLFILRMLIWRALIESFDPKINFVQSVGIHLLDVATLTLSRLESMASSRLAIC